LLFWLVVLGGIVASPFSGFAREYRTVEVESLKITIDSDWATRVAPGYLPVRFDITNLGEARVIEIVGQGWRFFRTPRPGPGGGTAVRQEVRLARGDRVRLTMPVPVYADNENMNFQIREDGRTLERFNYSGAQGRIAATDAPALIVAETSSAFARVAASWPRKITASTGPVRGTASGASHPTLDFTLDPARLPTNWLGFTSLRAVVVGSAEWGRLEAAQKEALLTWTACGGDLFVVDGALGGIVPAAQHGPAPRPNGAATGYFLGRIHVPTSDAMTAGGLAAAVSAATALQDANWALPMNSARDWGVITARGFRLPIPGVEGVPARAYLLILLVFSLLIGPVNYWFFRRRRQQVLVVLTAPLISAMFLVLLAGYVLVGEGLGVRARAVTFTMLDEARRQAVTRASISLYAAGMTPAGGLQFSRDTAVLPIGPDGTGSRDQQTLDLTVRQRFATGAIRARSPTNLEQVTFRPARERLTFSREAGGVGVTNGLGATVAVLAYHDGAGTHTLTAPLPAGGKALLQAGSRDLQGVVPTDLPQFSRFQDLFAQQPAGSYLALLESSPFWEPGVEGAAERGSFHLVLGWPGGQP
jgi:hypothetical protein